MTTKKHIVIIGAGFAGLKLARILNNNTAYKITLIDKNNYHQFQPLFYQVAVANLDASNISFPLRNIFEKSKNISVRVANVIFINTAQQILETSCGCFNYDYLVIATGATTNYFENKAIEEFSFPMKSTWDALQIRNTLIQHFEDAISLTTLNKSKNLTIIIVGGGATGVELSGALAEMKSDSLPYQYPELDFTKMSIYLIEGSDRLLSSMSAKSSKTAKVYLEKMGVTVKTKTIVKEYNGAKIVLQDNSILESTLVIWAAGVKGNSPKGINPLSVTKTNQIKTDIYNRVASTQNIFALGDIAFVETELYPKGFPQLASVAIDQAKNLANNFKRLDKQQQILPYKYINKGNMATVGRNKAVVDLAKPKLSFQGFFAWIVWMTLHLFLLIGFKNRIIVFINWIYKYFTHRQSLALFYEGLKKNKISTILLISLLVISCNTENSKQKILKNINDKSSHYISNQIIDTRAINTFLNKNNNSDSVKIEVNQFYKKRNYTFAWLNDDGAKQAVSFFYNQLKNYNYYFQNSTINSTDLELLINELNEDKENFLSQKNKSKQLELQLTTTFFKFAKVAYGGSASNLQNLEWFIPRQYKNYQLLLDSLITITKGKKVNEPLNQYYFRLKIKLIQYRNIEINGGFPIIIAPKKTLLLGNIDSIILPIKQYLFLTSDLLINDGTNMFNDSLQKAVKKFQYRMGLIENGTMDSITIIELNKPIAFRIQQIMVNMERLRWLPVTMEKDYLFINIPEFKLHLFKNSESVWVTNIVVGKSATQTSIFKSNVSQIILNPYWGVPQSIANNEILTHLKNNSNYLKDNNMEVLSSNSVINPNTINWNNYESHVPFMFRQKPGNTNALGKIKFLFPNNYDIYLHDTPSKYLFDGNKRAFSHGCIRVSDPKKLATYLLLDEHEWNIKRINKILKTDKETSIKLISTIPIYIVYFTSWVDNAGQLSFRNDLYDLDKKLSLEIFGEKK